MKRRKVISFVTAAVMAMASLPVLAASAESAYQLGDVDMDGVITGHDTAMISRYLYDEEYTLTKEQRVLADVNADGMIDQTDNEWIHENEVYAIGDVLDTDGWFGLQMGAWYALTLDSCQRLGNSITVYEADTLETDMDAFETALCEEKRISSIAYNLLDADANGTVDVFDACGILFSSSYKALGLNSYFAEGRYDLFRGGYALDIYDMDTYHIAVRPVEEEDEQGNLLLDE